MNQKRLLFGTNWKMHKTVDEATAYSKRLVDLMPQLGTNNNMQLFVIPPFTAIQAVQQVSQGRFWVGAQNMHWSEWGPFTGEISAPMLRELSVDLVELGHAERRQHFNETDSAVNRKVETALRFGLRPLVCVGEEAADKEYGVERETIARQVKIALNGVKPADAGNLIIAYEPGWAIGDTGTVAEVEWVRDVTAFIRALLTDLFGSEVAFSIPVLYGGSVTTQDAAQLLTTSEVDGLFVGRAALDPESFCEVVKVCLAPAARHASGTQTVSP